MTKIISYCIRGPKRPAINRTTKKDKLKNQNQKHQVRKKLIDSKLNLKTLSNKVKIPSGKT